MSFITDSYFIKSIPVTGVSNSNTGNESAFATYIDRYEKEILLYGLGYELYTDLQDALAAVSGVPGDLTGIWGDLVNGKDYTIVDVEGNTVEVRWNGILNTDLESFVAYYIWFYWKTDRVQQETNIGTVVSKVENSSIVASHRQMVQAWNKFVELYGEIPYKMSYGRKYYDISHQTGVASGNTFRSMKDFIEDMNEAVEDTYANWVFVPFEKLNIMGF